MKKRRIFIYVMVTIILICGIGYAYLNTDLSLENNVSLTSLKRYAVTFDYNDGITESTSKTVVYGKEYGSLPEPPEREGYRFLGWIQSQDSSLPNQYKKIAYLESTNGQYINTGLKANVGYQVDLDVAYTKYAYNKPAFGAWTTRYGYLIIMSSDNEINLYSGDDNSTYYSFSTFDTNRHLFSIRNTGVYLDNVLLNTNVLYNYPYEHDLYVFAASSNGRNPTAYRANFKLYSLIIKDIDNNVVRNYVPVLNKENHKLGLYDTVNNLFYPNLSAGEFVTEYTFDSTIVKEAKNHTLYAVWEEI